MKEKQPKSYLTILTNGLLKENPVLRLVLGCCPVLAVTTSVFNGLGMGAAATFVLLCSNIVISLLRKVIPSTVRLPCFIVVIAGFVTLVQMIVRAYVPALDTSLGVFLPLITVNCIILGRAEMFASKNKVFASALDGIGMGVGFTLALVLMSAMRELMGAGTLLGFQILPESIQPLSIMILPPGGFFVFGVLMALAIFVERKMGASVPKNVGCAVCPAGDTCPGKESAE